ncbi:MAG: hypothetical protein WEE89_02265 [Gemmatimonadota bacterium]
MSQQQQKNTVKIELTEQQRKQIKDACGEEFSSFEFSAEQLEDRVAPLMSKVRFS